MSRALTPAEATPSPFVGPNIHQRSGCSNRVDDMRRMQDEGPNVARIMAPSPLLMPPGITYEGRDSGAADMGEPPRGGRTSYEFSSPNLQPAWERSAAHPQQNAKANVGGRSSHEAQSPGKYMSSSPLAQQISVQRKESDQIRVPPYPTVKQFDSWRRQVKGLVAASSGRAHEATAWINEIEARGTTLQSLTPTHEWGSLDAKLWTALNAIAKGEVQRKIGVETDYAASQGKMFGGRQCLYLIYLEFRENSEKMEVFALRDFQRLKCGKGLRNMEQFLNQWSERLLRVKTVLPDSLLVTTFHEQLLQSECMQWEMVAHDLIPAGDYGARYSFLWKKAKEKIEAERQERHYKERIDEKNSDYEQQNYSLYARPEEGSKGKGKGKGKKGKDKHATAMPSQVEKPKLVCFYWLRGDECPSTRLGRPCRYEHPAGKNGSDPRAGRDLPNRRDSRGESRSPSPVDKGSRICIFHSRPGGCKHGNNCEYLHPAPGTSLVAREQSYSALLCGECSHVCVSKFVQKKVSFGQDQVFLFNVEEEGTNIIPAKDMRCSTDRDPMHKWGISDRPDRALNKEHLRVARVRALKLAVELNHMTQ